MVDVVFKVLIVGCVAVWSLAFLLTTADVADKDKSGKLMAMSFVLALASGLAWWVLGR